LFIASCVTNDSTRNSNTQSVSEWHRTRITVSEHSPDVGIAEAASASPSTENQPLDLATRDDFVRKALESNPGIQAAVAMANAKLERVAQVTSLPDPMLKAVARLEPIQTAAGDTYFTLAIAQKLPLLERLTRSGNIAPRRCRLGRA